MRLTRREQVEISCAMKHLVKDMRRLVKNYPESEIKIPAFRLEIGTYGKNWYLVITSKVIKLVENSQDSTSVIAINGILNYMVDENDYLAQYHFIKNYDEIRENLVQIVEDRQRKIDENIAMIQNTGKKYFQKSKEQKRQKQATIELEVPPSNNQYQLEVTEENGVTLGKLNFNGLTLKIIASDGIKIVNKTAPKQKRK